MCYYKHAATYMAIAELWAERSYCQNAKVGCIIVKEHAIISDGYNGMPSGFPNQCELDSGLTSPLVLHAEANALAKLLKAGNSSTGAILFTTLAPCLNCAKLIYQAGIAQLYYRKPYRDPAGLDFLKQTSILIHQL